MGRSSSDSRPTLPPPFDVARFARDSDERATRSASDEYEIEFESGPRSLSGIRRSVPPAPTARPGPSASYNPGALDSIGALEVFVDASPMEHLLSSIEIEVAEAVELPSEMPPTIRPSPKPPTRSSSMLPRESMRQIPALADGGSGLGRLGGLDPRAAFLISRFDGYSDLETIVDISGMTTDEAVDIVSWLVEEGIVVLS